MRPWSGGGPPSGRRIRGSWRAQSTGAFLCTSFTDSQVKLPLPEVNFFSRLLPSPHVLPVNPTKQTASDDAYSSPPYFPSVPLEGAVLRITDWEGPSVRGPQ